MKEANKNASNAGSDNAAAQTDLDAMDMITVKPSCHQIAGVEGEVRASDLRIPTLGIGQGVGPLADQFRPGNIVLGGQTLLSAGPDPVEIAVLCMRKFYQEKLPYGSEQRPMLFEREADLRAAGGTLEWGPCGEPPTYEPVLEAHLLIRRPDGVDGAFPYEFDGKEYAAARWFIRGMAYKNAGRSILTTAAQFAGGGKPLASARMELTTSREKMRNGNTVAVPHLRVVGKNDEAFCAFAAGLIG